MERKDTTISTPHNEGDPAGPAPPKEGASFGGPFLGYRSFLPASIPMIIRIAMNRITCTLLPELCGIGVLQC